MAAAPVVTYLFTLTNTLPGDLDLDIGTIYRGGTMGTNVLSQDVRQAMANGRVTCVPAVNLTPTFSSITNGLSSYTVASGNTLVDPGAGANRTNFTILSNAVIALQNQVAYLMSMVESADFTYTQGRAGAAPAIVVPST